MNDETHKRPSRQKEAFRLAYKWHFNQIIKQLEDIYQALRDLEYAVNLLQKEK